MTVLDADDVTKSPRESTAPHAARPFHTKTLAVVVLIALALIVANKELVRYQPLATTYDGEYGSYVVNAAGDKAVDHDAPTSLYATDPDPVSPGGVVWTEPRGTFTVESETTITNSGPWAVRLDGLAPPVGVAASNVRLYFYRDGANGSNGARPFRPFSLAAHARVKLVLDYDATCRVTPVDESPTFVNALPATYTFLGLRHTTDVPAEPYALVARAC